MRRRSNFFKRIDEQRESKSERKERLIKEEKEATKNLENIILNCFLKGEKSLEYFILKKDGLPDFFEEILLEKNKIHIIRGNNGQGKSTLLSSIVDANFLGAMNSFSNRLKISSTDKETANFLNFNLPVSPYKREDDCEYFPSKLKYDLTNIKNSITIYTDFSVGYFREKDGNIFYDISEDYDRKSNGERKIKGINDIFYFLKFILNTLKNNDKDGYLDLFIVMDEPESGLSLEIQNELVKKIKRYISLSQNINNFSLTFIISSHSFAWQKHKNVMIHNIQDFKSSNIKKEYKSVFI